VPRVILHSFYAQLLLIMFLVLIVIFHENQTFSSDWSELGLIGGRIGPKQGENEIFKNRE